MISAVQDDRFVVRYQVQAGAGEIESRALAIALEQTVELPEDLVPRGFIRDEIVGRIENIRDTGNKAFVVDISYLCETTGSELTQLLNVMFGNSSIKQGIRLMDFDLPTRLASVWSGPRFGIEGIRSRVGKTSGPLLQTALKPMGLSAKELAELAWRFAMGGVDVIKDDHGLANQPWAPFEERVAACAEAVEKANRETGRRAVYAPNVTGDYAVLGKRIEFAVQQGAGALLVSPGLIGFDTLRNIAENDAVNVPLISHPTLLGANVISPGNGFCHGVIFGKLQRLVGADATIYPNYGGRFGFSKAECQTIAQTALCDWHHFKPIAPTPGGGMTLDRIPEMRETYGDDVMYLIGGGLYGADADLIKAVQKLLSVLNSA